MKNQTKSPDKDELIRRFKEKLNSEFSGFTNYNTERIIDLFYDFKRDILDDHGEFFYPKEERITIKNKDSTTKTLPSGEEIVTKEGLKYSVKLLKNYQDFISN